MVMICVSVPARTTAAAIETIKSLYKPDMIELRFDYADESLDLATLRESTCARLIATARLPGHGGRWARDEAERQALFLSAADAGFDYVDVEADSCHLGALTGRLRTAGAKVVVSRHRLDGTPPLDEMISAHHRAVEAGADVVKMVGTAASPADNLTYLEYVARAPGSVGFAMGSLGVPSRVLSPLLGGAWTYASAGEAVAPGQPTLGSLREVYRLMGVET